MASNREDEGEDVSRATGDAYRYTHPSGARPPPLMDDASMAACVPPKRPRPLRPEYEFYPPHPPYQRMPPGAAPMNDYWNPRPAMVPSYALDPSMIPAPPTHYSHHYPSAHSATAYDYGYDTYSCPPYPAADYGDPYQMGKHCTVECDLDHEVQLHGGEDHEAEDLWAAVAEAEERNRQVMAILAEKHVPTGMTTISISWILDNDRRIS